MHMEPVSSKAIAAVGYDAPTRTLHVRFHSGAKIYDFPNIDAHEHAAFLAAPSLGKHYHAHIRARAVAS
jgi:hypothetical protein